MNTTLKFAAGLWALALCTQLLGAEGSAQSKAFEIERLADLTQLTKGHGAEWLRFKGSLANGRSVEGRFCSLLKNDSCDDILKQMNNEELYKFLGFSLRYWLSLQKTPSHPLGFHKHYLASLFAANALLNVTGYASTMVEDAIEVATKEVVQGAGREAAISSAREATSMIKRNRLMAAARTAIWDGARYAGMYGLIADARQAAEDAASKTVMDATQGLVHSAALAAARTAAHQPRTISPENIGKAAYESAEKLVQVYLVKNAVNLWDDSYQAASQILDSYELSSNAEFYLADLTAINPFNPYLKPYITVLNQVDSQFKQALTRESTKKEQTPRPASLASDGPTPCAAAAGPASPRAMEEG